MTPIERSNFIKHQLREFIEFLQGDDIFITGWDFRGETELIEFAAPDMTICHKTGGYNVSLNVSYKRP